MHPDRYLHSGRKTAGRTRPATSKGPLPKGGRLWEQGWVWQWWMLFTAHTSGLLEFFPKSLSFYDKTKKNPEGHVILLYFVCLCLFNFSLRQTCRKDTLAEWTPCTRSPAPTTITPWPGLPHPNPDPWPQSPLLCEVEANPRHHLSISISSSWPYWPAITAGRALWGWAITTRS